jgi:hypothetical protein
LSARRRRPATITLTITKARAKRLDYAVRMLTDTPGYQRTWTHSQVLARFLDKRDGVEAWALEHNPRPVWLQRKDKARGRRERLAAQKRWRTDAAKGKRPATEPLWVTTFWAGWAAGCCEARALCAEGPSRERAAVVRAVKTVRRVATAVLGDPGKWRALGRALRVMHERSDALTAAARVAGRAK